MKITTFSRFCEKQVVNCRNGKIIGFPTDIKLDTENGKILSVFVCEANKIPLFTKPAITEIPWEKIDKVGEDLIIVDADCFAALQDKPKKEKKYFFGG